MNWHPNQNIIKIVVVVARHHRYTSLIVIIINWILFQLPLFNLSYHAIIYLHGYIGTPQTYKNDSNNRIKYADGIYEFFSVHLIIIIGTADDHFTVTSGALSLLNVLLLANIIVVYVSPD